MLFKDMPTFICPLCGEEMEHIKVSNPTMPQQVFIRCNNSNCALCRLKNINALNFYCTGLNRELAIILVLNHIKESQKHTKDLLEVLLEQI